jgi:hypothetical protein
MAKHIKDRAKLFILPTTLFNPTGTLAAPNKFLHLFIVREPAVLAYVMWHNVKIKNIFNVFKIAYCREVGDGGQRLRGGRGDVALKNSLGCHYWQCATSPPCPPIKGVLFSGHGHSLAVECACSDGKPRL